MKRLSLLALAAATVLSTPMTASSQPMYHHGYGHRQAMGRIVSVQGSSFTLDNGRVVFLKPGTVINPTGRHLHAGQRVQVSGMTAGDRNINAQTVNIMPRY